MSEIFKKDLINLDKISQRLSKMGGQINKGINSPMKNFEKTTGKIEKAMQRLERTMSGLAGIVKRIGFMGGIGAGALFGALALRGNQALKNNVEAKKLGTTNQERGALEYAGKQGMGDSGFFKDILKNIKQASVSQEGADAFAMVGLDFMKMRDLPALEQLNKTLEALKNAKNIDPTILGETISNLTGLDYASFQALDLDKFRKDYVEGLTYNDNSTDKLKGVGESINKVTANLQLLVDKTLASLAPAMSKVMDNISKGINALAQNKSFQNLLNSIGDWATNITANFGDKIGNLIDSIPQILEDMQITFLRILSALAEASTWILMGEADKKASEFSKAMEEKANMIERERATRNQIQVNPNINIQIDNDATQAQTLKNFSNTFSTGGYGSSVGKGF